MVSLKSGNVVKMVSMSLSEHASYTAIAGTRSHATEQGKTVTVHPRIFVGYYCEISNFVYVTP